ncbi:hypothetical protein LTR85_009728 [Meristemomyces frigidus]|nr:hypothetical protein LTR85_009728 [Meristemomyces frigidus]
MSVTTSSLTRYSDGGSGTRHQSRKYRSAPRSVISNTSSRSAERDYDAQVYAQRGSSNVGSTTSATARSARLAAAAPGMPPPDYFNTGASKSDAWKFYESRREYEAQDLVAGAGRSTAERGYSGAMSYAGSQSGGDQYQEDDRRDGHTKHRRYDNRSRYDDEDEDDRYTISPSDSASQVSYASSAPSKALQLRRRASAVGGGYAASRACPWEAEWRARNPNYGADERPYYDESNGCWMVDVRPGGN